MLLLTEPLVPVTVRVAVVGGRGPPPPPPPPQEFTPPITNIASNTKRSCRRLRFHPANIAASTPANTNGRRFKSGASRAFAVFETVTVSGTDVVVELTLAGFGLTAQLAPPGAPVQVKLTCPVNPPLGSNVTLSVAVPPAAMVCEVPVAEK